MQKSTETQATHGGHETRDVSVKFFTLVVAGFFALLLLGMSVSLWVENRDIERQRSRQAPPSPLADTMPRLPPEPRLQVTPAADLKKFHADEDAVLNHYAWIDAKSGIVRIPIERAMELTAARGLPVRGEEGKETTKQTTREARK